MSSETNIHIYREYSHYWDIDEINDIQYESMITEIEEIIEKYGGYYVEVAQ